MAWGFNFNGRLGNSSTTDSLVPVQVTGLSSGVTAVSAGKAHSCAVVSGGVQCWGSNVFGKLGNNSTTQSLVPVQVTGLSSGATAVSAGDSHSCAVANGGAQCWGKNLNGQLGNNSTTSSNVPVQAIPAAINVTAVSAGEKHSCAVVSGGSVCWGSNSNGQLADAYSSPPYQPVTTLTLVIVLPTTTAVNTSASPVAAGTSLTLTATVTGSNPVGFVNFKDGGSSITGCDSVALSVGSAQCVTYFTTAGTKVITAVYSGDTNNAASTSPTLTQTVLTNTGAPVLIGVVSRKTHTGIGTFDVVIDTAQAINGLVTVEPRTIGAGHTIRFQFNNIINAAGNVLVIDGTNAAVGATAAALGNEVIVTIPALADNKRVTLTLSGVNATVNPPSVSMGFLVGDVNNTRSVNSSDISGVKARSGQTTSAANFKFDVNATGAINSSDISAVKARSGLTLP